MKVETLDKKENFEFNREDIVGHMSDQLLNTIESKGANIYIYKTNVDRNDQYF